MALAPHSRQGERQVEWRTEFTAKPGQGYFSGGTTFGNTFVTIKLPQDIATEVLTHEDVHATQWAVSGGLAGLPLGYLAATGISYLTTGRPDCGNFYEWQAGFDDGGYKC